jgi:hypothetical protein
MAPETRYTNVWPKRMYEKRHDTLGRDLVICDRRTRGKYWRPDLT